MPKWLNRSLVIAVFLLLIATGCNQSDAQIYENARNGPSGSEEETASIYDEFREADTQMPQNPEAGGLSGTITVSSYWDFNMRGRIDAFQELHPDVEIIWEGRDYGDLVDENYQDYRRRTATEMMAGTAPDIVDLAGMAYYQYARSGLLLDLYTYMKSDDSFHMEDYYSNIFEALEYKGGLYTLPFAFQYSIVYFSNPLSEAMGIDPADYQSIDYQEMLSLYNDAAVSGSIPPTTDFLPGLDKNRFFAEEIYSFYDISTGEINFESDSFLRYLELTNTIDIRMENYLHRLTFGVEDFMLSDYLFSLDSLNSIEAHNALLDYQYVGRPIPYISQNGNAVFETLKFSYGITQSSLNKELAWKFLKFCIDEKTPPPEGDYDAYTEYMLGFEGWIPVNIANFRNLFRLSAKSELQLYLDDPQSTVAVKQGDHDQILDAYIEEVHRMNQGRNCVAADNDLMDVIQIDLENFYNYQLHTAEETAKIIQDKITTYMNE